MAEVPPTNDDFANALDLPAPPPTALAIVDNTSATLEIGEPAPSCADAGFGKTMWFKVTPSTRMAVSVETLASDFNTILAIYSGAGLGTLSEIACNDFILSGPQSISLGSRAVAILQSGVTYHIQVGGFNASSGSIAIKLARRKSQPGVVRGNQWFLSKDFNGTAEHGFAYGLASDDVLTGDWAGLGGIAAPGVHRGNTWYPNLWFDGQADDAFPYGKTGDFPVVGDWDGDSQTTVGVVRGNVWYLSDGLDVPIPVPPFGFGKATDFPIVGDWDADGVTTPAVVRGNTWYLSNGFDGIADVAPFAFGKATDYAIAGDWDGDGDVTPGVVRGNLWFLTNGTGPVVAFTLGTAGDVPIVGDWGPIVEG